MDDSPYNIALSDAYLKIMLPHPWNQSPVGIETCKNSKPPTTQLYGVRGLLLCCLYSIFFIFCCKNANPIIIPTFKEALDYVCRKAKVT